MSTLPKQNPRIVVCQCCSLKERTIVRSRHRLDVSETQYSLAYGVATILSGVALPFVGRLIDRLGSYNLALVGFAVVPLVAAGLVMSAKPPQAQN